MVHEEAFFFGNGRHASSVKELRDILAHEPHEVTGHHITADKNDYASWIRHVIGEETLARRLDKTRSVDQVLQIISDYLNEDVPIEPEPEPVHEPAPEPVHHEEIPPQQDRPQQRPPVAEHPPKLPAFIHLKHRKPGHLKDFITGLVTGLVVAFIAYWIAGIV